MYREGDVEARLAEWSISLIRPISILRHLDTPVQHKQFQAKVQWDPEYAEAATSTRACRDP